MHQCELHSSISYNRKADHISRYLFVLIGHNVSFLFSFSLQVHFSIITVVKVIISVSDGDRIIKQGSGNVKCEHLLFKNHSVFGS